MNFKKIIILLSIFTSKNIHAAAEDVLPESNGFYRFVNRIHGFSIAIGHLLWPVYTIEELYKKITSMIDDSNKRKKKSNIIKRRENKFKNYYCKINDFENCLENINKLDESLDRIVGQKYAKDIIRKSMISIIQKYYEFDFLKDKKKKEIKDKKNELEKKLREKKVSEKEIKKQVKTLENKLTYENRRYFNNGPGCTFMYFVGPAGTGKTETALSLVSSITNDSKQPYIIDASTLLSKDGKFSTLLKEINLGSKYEPMTIPADLDAYIRSSKRGIIVFNEIDKILERQDLAADLNETLRTLKDNNYYISSRGEKIDVSGFLFIFTSNEKINESEYDPTGSMTKVYFNQSLRTRFILIPFKDFNCEEYEELIRRYFIETNNTFLDVYKNYEISINFEENIEKYCAKFIYNDIDLKKRGARGIYDVIGNDLKSKLFILLETLKQNNTLTNKKIYISFDENINEFIINDKDFIKREKKIIKPKTKFKTLKKIVKIILIIILITILILFILKKNRIFIYLKP